MDLCSQLPPLPLMVDKMRRSVLSHRLFQAHPSIVLVIALLPSAVCFVQRCANEENEEPKVILVTGSTDGIGLEAARMLVSLGHHVILHGRNPTKLENTRTMLATLEGGGQVETFLADLSTIQSVEALAAAVKDNHTKIDVLVNNAGVFAPGSVTRDGLDVRFAVNTIAPYLLTELLLPIISMSGRVINLSSAAQSPVNIDALTGHKHLPDRQAYSQSKLALTMWSRHLGLSLRESGPAVVAVNPGSLLGTKMVHDAFGVDGGDVRVGGDTVCRAAVERSFQSHSGEYWDGDTSAFAKPHADALDEHKTQRVVDSIRSVIAALEESFR